MTPDTLDDLDHFLCPTCVAGTHECPDFYTDPAHGLVACDCTDCWP